MEMRYIGIDIGGTDIKGGIILSDGTGIVTDKLPTEAKKGSDAVIANIGKLIDILLKESKLTIKEIAGIGIGIPGMIDSVAGKVVYSNNLAWRDVDVVAPIVKAYGVPVRITNDANAAALGEARFGAAKEYANSIFVTLGTGVGGGIIIDNKIFEGNQSAGAELGHMVIKKGGYPCTCGRLGCFEAYASATALIRNTRNIMRENPASKMNEVAENDVTGKTAFDYYETDIFARRVVDEYISDLACGVNNLINIFRPEVIMLGGGVCAQGERLLKPLREIIEHEIYGGPLGPVVLIVTAKLGNSAGYKGAAALNIPA